MGNNTIARDNPKEEAQFLISEWFTNPQPSVGRDWAHTVSSTIEWVERLINEKILMGKSEEYWNEVLTELKKHENQCKK